MTLTVPQVLYIMMTFPRTLMRRSWIVQSVNFASAEALEAANRLWLGESPFRTQRLLYTACGLLAIDTPARCVQGGTVRLMPSRDGDVDSLAFPIIF